MFAWPWQRVSLNRSSEWTKIEVLMVYEGYGGLSWRNGYSVNMRRI